MVSRVINYIVQIKLDLQNNYLRTLPTGILQQLPMLKQVSVGYNFLEDIPSDLANLEMLEIHGNPLSNILSVYRSNSKVCEELEIFLIFLS